MEFGNLFKRLRKATGLSLREFCRQYNLDAANISRLERGLVRPPQSKAILESYAQALSIPPESPQWAVFFELAASENGKVSPQIQESQVMRQNLPRVFRKLREEIKSPGARVTALDLELWAFSYGAAFVLPRLIRRLIRTTVKDRIRVEFPADEGVSRPGPDGVVEVREGNEFVPAGGSIWEIGTEKDIKGKADTDFAKRTDQPPLGLDTRQLVFVFITPRKWTKKNEWREEKKKLGLWKDVRVYDSAVLEEWLEVSTATDIWLAKLIGKRPAEGIVDMEEHWENLAALSKPALKPEVFLTSRKTNQDMLDTWFAGPPKSLALEAHSPGEVIDFVAAHIAQLSEDKKDALEVQTVIVEDNTAWRSLCSSGGKFFLVPKASMELEPETISGAVRQGHHVLVCLPRILDEDSLKLSRAYEHDLEHALVGSGFKENEARRLARESGGSLTIMKRRLSGSINIPAWSKEPGAESLLPILMVGRWDESSIADQKIIEALGGNYASVLATANRYRVGNDPVTMRVLSAWSIISRDDSWEFLAVKFSAQQLDVFEKIAIKVLSENDPRYDLPPKERWYAALNNKSPKFSEHLRKGIVETIALLGAGNAAIISVPISPDQRAARMVRKLLLDADWKRWASLKHQLPLLAEASPEAFMEAVEKDLASTQPQLAMLFVDEDECSFMSPCNYAGLLWALETLAWNPNYLCQVTLLLASLKEITPVKLKTVNAPTNSLKEIFLPWLPHTTATLEQRIAVLGKLCDEFPKIGLNLLLELLPSSHSSSMNTHQPSWRGWALGWSRTVTHGEYWKHAEWCAEKLVNSLGKDGDLWSAVLGEIENLPKVSFDNLIGKLKTIHLKTLSTGIRQIIFNALRDKITRHRSFPDAEWCMPEETLLVLESLKERFEPTDLISKYKWLFVSWPEFPEDRYDLAKKEQLIFERRLQVLKEFIDKEGVDKIKDFALEVDNPHSIGYVLGKSNLLDDKHLLPHNLNHKQQKIANLAVSYAGGRFNANGWPWIKGLPLNKWSSAQAGNLLLVLPFEWRTWSLVESLGKKVESHYWSAQSFDIYRGNDPKDIAYAISKLIQYRRPFRAVDIIDMAIHNKCQVQPEIVMDALEATLKLSDKEVKAQMSNNERYRIQELFKFLQEQRNFDQVRLASLEWAYISLLDDHHDRVSPKTLHNLIQSDPKLFADVIARVFRPKNESKKSKISPTDQERAAALNAYKLLESLKSVPGIDDHGVVNDEKLKKWVTEVRSLCKKSDRLEVCDSRIGEIFAYAPTDNVDKVWPCKPVMEIIEKCKSEDLERGLQRGIYNKRGIHSKSMTEGGQQEYALAKYYTDLAEKIAILWPRTAAVLRNVAGTYEKEAKMRDEEAQPH